MKIRIQKPDWKFVLQAIICFVFLNVTINMIGLWITKLLKPEEFSYLDSIFFDFVKPLLVQTGTFAVLLTVGLVFFRKRTWAEYLFAIFQFVNMHIVFFLHLHNKNGLKFYTSIKNPGLIYLGNCGNYLVDILYLYFPINGVYDNGVFMPNNWEAFYIHWILLAALYFAALTWLTFKAVIIFFGKDGDATAKTEKPAKPEENIEENADEAKIAETEV